MFDPSCFDRDLDKILKTVKVRFRNQKKVHEMYSIDFVKSVI